MLVEETITAELIRVLFFNSSTLNNSMMHKWLMPVSSWRYICLKAHLCCSISTLSQRSPGGTKTSLSHEPLKCFLSRVCSSFDHLLDFLLRWGQTPQRLPGQAGFLQLKGPAGNSTSVPFQTRALSPRRAKHVAQRLNK